MSSMQSSQMAGPTGGQLSSISQVGAGEGPDEWPVLDTVFGKVFPQGFMSLGTVNPLDGMMKPPAFLGDGGAGLLGIANFLGKGIEHDFEFVTSNEENDAGLTPDQSEMSDDLPFENNEMEADQSVNNNVEGIGNTPDDMINSDGMSAYGDNNGFSPAAPMENYSGDGENGNVGGENEIFLAPPSEYGFFANTGRMMTTDEYGNKVSQFDSFRNNLGRSSEDRKNPLEDDNNPFPLSTLGFENLGLGDGSPNNPHLSFGRGQGRGANAPGIGA